MRASKRGLINKKKTNQGTFITFIQTKRTVVSLAYSHGTDNLQHGCGFGSGQFSCGKKTGWMVRSTD